MTSSVPRGRSICEVNGDFQVVFSFRITSNLFSWINCIDFKGVFRKMFISLMNPSEHFECWAIVSFNDNIKTYLMLYKGRWRSFTLITTWNNRIDYLSKEDILVFTTRMGTLLSQYPNIWRFFTSLGRWGIEIPMLNRPRVSRGFRRFPFGLRQSKSPDKIVLS